MLRKFVLAAAMVGLTATTAVAQRAPLQFSVGPRFGLITYDDDTGIDDAAMLGLDAIFHLNENVGFGITLDVARPSTDGSFFPSEMSFGDTTFVFGVAQPITVVQFAAMVELTTGGRFAPFINGSLGGYRITTDPQVGGNRNFTELGLGFGGGVEFITSGATSIRLEVRDMIFTNFDRSILNPVRNTFQPTRFPDVLPAKTPFDGTAHNIHLALAFSFTPGGGQ